MLCHDHFSKYSVMSVHFWFQMRLKPLSKHYIIIIWWRSHRIIWQIHIACSQLECGKFSQRGSAAGHDVAGSLVIAWLVLSPVLHLAALQFSGWQMNHASFSMNSGSTTTCGRSKYSPAPYASWLMHRGLFK